MKKIHLYRYNLCYKTNKFLKVLASYILVFLTANFNKKYTFR